MTMRINVSVLKLLILTLIIHGAISSDTPNYMSDSCEEKSSYDSGSVFETNLNNTLFTQLLPKSSKEQFGNYSTGLGEDQVYALFYCKGDVDAQTCQDCIKDATTKIKDVCESSKEGIVWYKECTLRYANRNFSLEEEIPNYIYPNNTGIVNEYILNPYKDEFDSTMETLIREAAYNKGTLPGFATIEVNLSSTGMIRGLAQCFPAFLGAGCYKCLKASLDLRDSPVNTMVFLPSCLFQYDLYGTLDPPTSPPPPHTFRAVYIAPIVVGVVVFIAVVIGGRLLWKRFTVADDSTGRVSAETRRSPDVEQNPVANRGDRKQGLPRYTFSEVKKMTKKFKTEIGKGAFGVVHLGQLGSTRVAVKTLNKNDAPEQFANEINVFAKTSHKNLVSLLGYCEDRTRLALIYEYMDRGDLKGILSDDAGSLSWTNRLKIAIDVAEGLHYLHKSCGARIVHRDVKPANILINHKLEAKVADFGLSKIFPENTVSNLATRVVFTPGYTAPEYPNTGRLDEKVDVYSFGVVLVELITGKTPSSEFDLVGWFLNQIDEADIEEIFYLKMTSNEQRKQVLDDSSVWEAAELAKQCVCIDPKERPNMWDIITELKKYLDKEVRKTPGTSSTSTLSTTMETSSPINFGGISMEPQAT